MSRKSDILKRYYREVWENGNSDAIDDYFVTRPKGREMAPAVGIEPAEIREWMLVLRKFVYDIRVKVIQTVEEGDWISAMLEITCTDLNTDQPVKVHQQIMLRFEGDKKVESYPAFDFIRFFEQLGQLPTDTRALLLSGTKLD
jgi:hypothetical protein